MLEIVCSYYTKHLTKKKRERLFNLYRISVIASTFNRRHRAPLRFVVGKTFPKDASLSSNHNFSMTPIKTICIVVFV